MRPLHHLGTLCLAALAVSGAGAERPPAPPSAGLQLWLDASDERSIETKDGAVARWGDKSGNGRAVGIEGRPVRADGVFGGKPAVRFSGRDALRLAPISASAGPVTAFVVSQRLAPQAGGGHWQRLLSIRLGDVPDNKPPNLTLTTGGESGAFAPAVRVVTHDAVAPGALAIGGMAGGSPSFRGDIAEVLVYNRGFLSEGALREVMDYLAAKWGAAVAREDAGWTRAGPLGAPPARTSDALPLADQGNLGGWTPLPSFTDEFNDGVFDTNTWVSPHRWIGRAPALFRRSNVDETNGFLTLTMRLEDVSGLTKNTNYHTYTSAYVGTRLLVRYGCFEIRARPMDSAGSSSFWFTSGLKRWSTEIDVFEIGGRAPGRERAYNMNAHVWREDGTNNHWSAGGRWEAPWRLADDFHVYGFEWTPRDLVWHVDGVRVRSMPNTHWHVPMRLIFDSETMPDWFGLPRHEDLPSTFAIDYVRAWSHAETEVMDEDAANAREWPPSALNPLREGGPDLPLAKAVPSRPVPCVPHDPPFHPDRD